MLNFKRKEYWVSLVVFTFIIFMIVSSKNSLDVFAFKCNSENPIVVEKCSLYTQFYNDLHSGSFFHNESEFDFLVTDSNIYFISTNDSILEKKIMIHFIKDDGSFINKSFFFKSKEIISISCGITGESYLKVANVSFPISMDVNKVRIGQYDENGNLWAKLLDVPEIRKNRLLKYNCKYEGCFKTFPSESY